MNRDDFFEDFMNSVRTRAEIENDYTQSAFLSEMSERLSEAGEVENLVPVHFVGSGLRNRRIAVSGYDLDDPDGSVALAVLDFDEAREPATLTESEARRSFLSLENFLDEALTGTFQDGREESSRELQLAEDLRKRGQSVTRYRLYLLSNRVLSNRAKDLASRSLNGAPVDFHIWDIERLHNVHESNLGREELVIDLREWAPAGVAALRVSYGRAATTTYLCALPARLLADLYGRYGSRLLEGNVRSYLSARGSVNKGIKTTVMSSPDLFIAYNNGITATATGVELSVDGSAIIGLTDLQVVNGGQTTASLFFVDREQRNSTQLDDVSVQAKLVVVTPEKAQELVPNISRYANSQNKVSEADFFSNSPFHVRLEELSRRLLTPSRPGVSYQTKWFYERTRGQYLNERSKLSLADEKKFTATYPRNQLITKTDAAKYAVSWAQKPHLVSSGAQKNFVAFAQEIASRWESSSEAFNETYFKALVGEALLYNEVRAAVAKAEWYGSGYLANIVTYTVAKLASLIQTAGRGEFDFEAVWQRQGLSDAMRAFALRVAYEVMLILTSAARPVTNVTEWAKREACWTAVRSVRMDLPPSVIDELVSADTAVSARRSARVQQKLDDGIQAQTAVLAVEPHEWLEIQGFARSKRLLADADAGILALVTRARPGIPTERQAVRLIELRKRAVEHGYEYLGR